MKRILIIIYLLPFVSAAQTKESLSLQKAYEQAQKNYPLIKQKDLIKQTEAINVNNLSKGYLPQFTVSGQATYQSEVTEVKVPVPGVTISPLNKDQYKLLADVNQLVYDGGLIKQQKNIQLLNTEVEEQKIETELYKLRETINKLYLGILFLDEQLMQVDLVKKDIETGIKKVEAQVKNGVAFKSNLNVLKAELLKTLQRAIELNATRKGLVETLGLFMNEALPGNIKFEKPFMDSLLITTEIRRPELQLFSSQDKLIGSQLKLIQSKNLPKAGLFLQGGYGRPGLNFLKNEFSFFYTTGVRLSWSLGGLYTSKKEKELVEVNRKTVQVQKETFLLNTNTALKQQQAEIDKLQQLVAADNEIIELRISVKDAAKAQLENGVMTANDYLREVNAEDQARQTLITHQLQLLQAQINYQTIAGK
jgi:outer membrane protein TolC